MFRLSQDVQMTINDRMLTANTQTKKTVDSSRAKLVGDHIYPNVDESKFEKLYSEHGSRPNIEIRRYVSTLVLKRMYGLSDETLLEFLRCGALNFQYALHTTQEEIHLFPKVPSAVSVEKSKWYSVKLVLKREQRKGRPSILAQLKKLPILKMESRP